MVHPTSVIFRLHVRIRSFFVATGVFPLRLYACFLRRVWVAMQSGYAGRFSLGVARSTEYPFLLDLLCLDRLLPCGVTGYVGHLS